MWTPLQTIHDELPKNGVIRLYHEANYFSGSPWSTEGTFGKDIHQLFFVPAGFLYDSKDTFIYNFSLKYVNREEKVTGYVIHNGKRDLQEGKTEKFWHLDKNDPPKCQLMTHPQIKLPYLIVPDIGLPDYKEEIRYFIPVNYE